MKKAAVRATLGHKALIALLLSMAMILSSMQTAISANKSEVIVSVIDYGSWGSAASITTKIRVKIQNTSDRKVNNWRVFIPLTGITMSTIKTASDTDATIEAGGIKCEPKFYNKILDPGISKEFELQVIGNRAVGKDASLQYVEFESDDDPQVTADKAYVEVRFDNFDSWQYGTTSKTETRITVYIKNNGTADVNNWSATIPIPSGTTVNRNTDCTFTVSGDIIYITPRSDNMRIPPGEEKKFEIFTITEGLYNPIVTVHIDGDSTAPTPPPGSTATPTPPPGSTATPTPGQTATPTVTPPVSPTITPTPPASGLPTNIIAGYWENWTDRTRIKLRDVGPEWDVVIVAFMMVDYTDYNASFILDSGLYPGGEAEFISDIKYLQNQGKKVLISLGGETMRSFDIKTDAKRDAFLRTAGDIIAKYGFDGLDVDIEGGGIIYVSTTTSIDTLEDPLQKNLSYVLHELAKRFGEDFILTMCPEHPYVQGGAEYLGNYNGIYGGYLPLINNCRDILTFLHPQYYNNPINDYTGFSGYNVNSLVKLSEMLIDGFTISRTGEFFAGLRPDQVVMLVRRTQPSAGALTIAQYQEALRLMIQKYPTFRGISVWSINDDRRSGESVRFEEAMRQIINTYGQSTPQASTAGVPRLSTNRSGSTSVIPWSTPTPTPIPTATPIPTGTPVPTTTPTASIRVTSNISIAQMNQLSNSVANSLFDLKLFMGTGTAGEPVFELERQMTRMEAIALIIRLMGLEEQANAFTDPNPFGDTPAWGDRIAAFAYSQGITVGVNQAHTLLNANGFVSYQEFTTFLLRILGYEEKNNDFTFGAARDKAKEVGLFSSAETEYFTGHEYVRGSAVVNMADVLLTNTKSSNQKLIDQLVARGVISRSGADTFIENVSKVYNR